MINGVLFDMDGLMFDTERLGTRAWMEVGRRHHIPITEDVLNTMRGRVLSDCIRIFKENYGEDFDFWGLRKERTVLFESYLQQGMPIKTGLRELLAYLRENQIKISLATSTDRRTAERYLDMAEIKGYFDVLLCGDMVTHGKPDPEIYIKAVSALGERPENCLVLEDSVLGVYAGYRAGCHVIMIPDMVEPGEEERQRAELCADTLLDVIEYLKAQITG